VKELVNEPRLLYPTARDISVMLIEVLSINRLAS